MILWILNSQCAAIPGRLAGDTLAGRWSTNSPFSRNLFYMWAYYSQAESKLYDRYYYEIKIARN